MAILIIGAAALAAAVIYGATTRPCQSGWHGHRHWRFRSHRGWH